MTYKEWQLECSLECGWKGTQLLWDYDIDKAKCPDCGQVAWLLVSSKGQSAGITTDEIPGGIEIKHGLCNPDGSPKRYYSKTEIKRAANERGYTISGDTPKPYKVGWSGRQRRIDGLKGD